MEPATNEEIIEMLTCDNEKLFAENKDIKSKLYQIESELHRYKTAYKMLVKELSEKK